MKDARLIIAILIGNAISLAIVMVALNLYPSWSQYARSLEEPLLFGTLISISFMYLIKAYSNKDRDVLLFRFLGVDARVKHLNKATSVFFALVLVFPVTHDLKIISSLHLVFTGLAIATAYLELCFYEGTLLAYLGTFLGVFGFLGAFVLNLYTVGLGELFAALPLAFFTYWNIKLIDNG